MARSTARQVAMQLLYERLSGGIVDEENRDWAISQLSDRDDIDLSRRGVAREDREYIDQIVSGVADAQEELDALIEDNSDGWPIERMPHVDLSILRLAVYEMKHREDVPNNVAVSEALELANRYSEPKSGRFINGVLGAIARSLEE